MLREPELKEKLQAFSRDKFLPSGKEDWQEIIPAMLKYIGTTDPHLRDDLIYSAFDAWIVRHKALPRDQLRSLLPIILDEQHLLCRLGEQDTDSVFTRAFSVLALPLLLISHRSQSLFSAAEIQQIKETLLYYLENEKDRRGFVQEKGWAHAIAHAADALDDLAQCGEMNRSNLVEMLDAIRKAVCCESTYYAHLEDERMVTAVIAVLERHLLSDAEINQWLEGFSDLVLAVNSAPEKLIIRANAKNFLQSLYFRLQWGPMKDRFNTTIDHILQRINPFARYVGN